MPGTQKRALLGPFSFSRRETKASSRSVRKPGRACISDGSIAERLCFGSCRKALRSCELLSTKRGFRKEPSVRFWGDRVTPRHQEVFAEKTFLSVALTHSGDLLRCVLFKNRRLAWYPFSRTVFGSIITDICFRRDFRNVDSVNLVILNLHVQNF